MQSLIYPCKVMNITQTYMGEYSHINSYKGTPRSYPIDDIVDNKNKYFYAPCDVVVKRIYGVGNNGTNTIWLESVEKVLLANNKKTYITIMIVHPNDQELLKFKVGDVIKQYTKMFAKGDDGNTTGKHFHLEVATTKFNSLKNNGWVKNNKGAWVISNNSIKPENAFLIDSSFTKIINKQGLVFKNIDICYPKVADKYNSIIDALKSINVDSSYDNRKNIAIVNEINNYRGSYEQNIKLLKLLKQGKLKKIA